MINFSRLLNVKETARDVKKHYNKRAEEVPKHLIRYANVKAPMVAWNITRKCNFSCDMCHLDSALEADSDELTTQEAITFIDQMASMKVPMISVYGGEPLTRNDFFALAGHAHNKGLRIILSSNAALITEKKAREIAVSGISYVGIDMDGFSQISGAMDVIAGLEKALPAIKYLRDAGVGCGVRITIGSFNLSEMSSIIKAIENAGLKRFAVCQHFGGRDWKTVKEERREIIDSLIDYAMKNPEMEVVTEQLYDDGVYLLQRVAECEPELAAEMGKLLARQGGCPAGDRIVNVDYRGNVHLCPYWKDRTIGNIREQKLSDICFDEGNEILTMMKDKTRYLKGKCGRCMHNHICRGCGARAEEMCGDPFGADPACYLTEEEITGVCHS
ncbi:MAG: radical SAM protein [Candidatus Scalindua rubra]|uniref:Metallo cofactor biosynthesis protein n=1 Tax=Candidatus Scalindua brodae TaxID=237368 RepID=A0A0B0EE85_9BACT|nr:MAG: metallo cofactor biosynthesis protein [Candidatus Scalindua brodae]MBZ0107672.1 radical SAM protein [Candidatus Scalindua rubra]TWU35571.1 pyrroloquinoline quinone biosynthesis protein PqqE [Candidatus Brocadiaceae bacterium S225]